MLPNDIKEDTANGQSGSREAEPGAREPDTRQIPSAGVMLGVGMAIVGLGVLGWVVYRRRQQSRAAVRQLAGRVPTALRDVRDGFRQRFPDALDDVRDQLRAQMKRVRSR